MKVAIIGAGAAGMFCAANLSPQIEVDIFEASKFPLRKVRASGGGRCNFTNEKFDTSDLSEFYPRGAGSLKKPARRFGASESVKFFESLGVKTKIEDNGRIFPTCDDSRAITSALLRAAENNGAKILTEEVVTVIEKRDDGVFEITSKTKKRFYDAVVVCVGGLSDGALKDALIKLGIKIEPSVPSLFAIKTEDAQLPDRDDLSGISIPDAELRANFPDAKKSERKISSQGSIILTHFGIGGPAVLAFSAFGAKVFQNANYDFPFSINFAPYISENDRSKIVTDARKNLARKRVVNAPLFGLPQKLWTWFVEKSGIERETIFAALTKDAERKLTENIFNFQTRCIGRSAHKAEFVTCGGIAREEIDFSTMRSKKIDNLFFAGECIDIDAVTGGFNLQAAWTTAKICAETLNKTA